MPSSPTDLLSNKNRNRGIWSDKRGYEDTSPRQILKQKLKRKLMTAPLQEPRMHVHSIEFLPEGFNRPTEEGRPFTFRQI